jgi:hypothetical protein
MNSWLLSRKLTGRIVYIFYLIYQIMFRIYQKKYNIKSYTANIRILLCKESEKI